MRPSVGLTCDQDYWEGQHCSACGVSVSGHSPIITMTVSMSGLLVITESTQLTTLGSGSGPSSDHLEAPHSSVLTLILTLLEPGAGFITLSRLTIERSQKHVNSNTFKYYNARSTK